MSVGNVTAGRFAGPLSVATREVIKPQLDTALCGTTGIASDQGPAVLAIVGA